jgi:hypothetical protein
MKVQGHERSDTTHERRDADVVNLSMIGMIVFLTIGFCLLVCWIMLGDFNRGRQSKEAPRLKMTEESGGFPQPQLIREPGKERQRVLLSEEAKLKTYGWLDRKAGVAHIPIDRAMQVLLERGLPEVGAGQTRLQLLQSRPTSIMQPRDPITSPSPEGSP